LADFKLAFPVHVSEGYRVGADFSLKLESTPEADTIIGTTITAKDKDGVDVSATWLTQPAYTDTIAKVKLVKNVASPSLSPYELTIKVNTQQGDDFTTTVEVVVVA
jgi:uncharacterized protein (UPF0333 family)